MNDYLLYLSEKTKTVWWNDSGVLSEVAYALGHGAVGITTNPVLTCNTLLSCSDEWAPLLAAIPKELTGEERRLEVIHTVIGHLASMFEPIYARTNGENGYVCAQVDPRKATDRAAMYDMARKMASWAPNIAVKLPVTAAGLDVLEDCIAEGITITATASFTYAQVMAIGDRCEKGRARAAKAGIKPGKCFAVIMVGRIDDYLRDSILDEKLDIPADYIAQAGVAILKRAYRSYAEKGYTAVLMPAAFRRPEQVEALAGAKMAFSINIKMQVQLPKLQKPYKEHIDEDVDPAVIKCLMQCPEFVKAYEPDGLTPEQFFTFGAMQKTLSQFIEFFIRIGGK